MGCQDGWASPRLLFILESKCVCRCARVNTYSPATALAATAFVSASDIVDVVHADPSAAELLLTGPPPADDPDEAWDDPLTAHGPSDIPFVSYLPYDLIPTQPTPFKRFVRGWSFAFSAIAHLAEIDTIPTLAALEALLLGPEADSLALTTTPVGTIGDFRFFRRCGGGVEQALDALLTTMEDEAASGEFYDCFGVELDGFARCDAHDEDWVRARRELLWAPGWAREGGYESGASSVNDLGEGMEEL